MRWILAALVLSSCVQQVRGEAPPPAGTRAVVVAQSSEMPARLRLPIDADAAHPATLIVWLHPTGASLNAIIDALSPDFARLGYAVLEPLVEPSSGWSGAEANALLGPTLAAASRVPGVDARRPVLLGFSAGAQLALIVWRQTPRRFGGLAISAAGPFDLAGGEYVPLALPSGAAGTPLLVLIGERDSSAPAWRAREKDFIDAGVRLEQHRIAGAGHELLFDRAGREMLLAWLAGLRESSR